MSISDILLIHNLILSSLLFYIIISLSDAEDPIIRCERYLSIPESTRLIKPVDILRRIDTPGSLWSPSSGSELLEDQREILESEFNVWWVKLKKNKFFHNDLQWKGTCVSTLWILDSVISVPLKKPSSQKQIKFLSNLPWKQIYLSEWSARLHRKSEG